MITFGTEAYTKHLLLKELIIAGSVPLCKVISNKSMVK
jgi:hypothetical protein